MDIASIAERTIPLQELPQWSPWPARMLGQAEWRTPRRSLEKVDSEYDKDEYLRCLTFARQQSSLPSADDVRDAEFRIAEKKSICVSQRETLYELAAHRMIPTDEAILVESVAPLMEEVDTVVEIGCGYGINLWGLHKHFPQQRYYGGEYSQNAVELARLLYGAYPRISVETCNFYADTYLPLEHCPQGSRVLLFTRHAIEQLPTAAPFLETLTKYFDRLTAVVHLEVVQENYGTNLLGLMRKRYIEMNDYNRDLLTLLRRRKDIVVEKNEPDIFGISPLNPTSLLIWRPRS